VKSKEKKITPGCGLKNLRHSRRLQNLSIAYGLWVEKQGRKITLGCAVKVHFTGRFSGTTNCFL